MILFTAKGRRRAVTWWWGKTVSLAVLTRADATLGRRSHDGDLQILVARDGGGIVVHGGEDAK